MKRWCGGQVEEDTGLARVTSGASPSLLLDFTLLPRIRLVAKDICPSRRKLVLTSDEEDDEGIEDEVREVEKAPGQLVLSSVAKRIGGRGMQKGGRVILGNV